MFPGSTTLLILFLLLLTGIRSASAGYKDDIGYTRLQSELGVATPTGSGVGVSQTEAPDINGNHLPDTTLAEFAGKTFVTLSSSSGVSGHATTVGRYYYGSSTSIATGITSIHNYEATSWIGNDFLRTGTISAPRSETQKVQNNSWITATSGSSDEDALRRFDYSIETSNSGSGFVAVSGLNNGSGTTIPTLMANSYNGLVVGLSSGNHSSGQTTIDVAGRIKPDIVCMTPEQATSFATPVVSAAAAMLWQKALGDTALVSARNSVALKSILMAGATKAGLGGTWSRPANSGQPMDLHYGAGQLNIYNSYQILSAGKQSASDSVAANTRGWDYNTTLSDSPGRLYFFDIPAENTVSNFFAVLTWNRVVADGLAGRNWGNPTSTLPNLYLRLYEASGFIPGSVVDSSVSAIDNVQTVYQPNLPPGRYALEVTSATSGVKYGLAWYSVPTITITATTADAYELGASPGMFTIRRAGDTSTPLVVNYTINGTATGSTDYSAIPAATTIPSGATTATIMVTPLSDSQAEGSEIVTLTLVGDFASGVGAPDSASVTIHDTPFNQWRFDHFTQTEINDPTPGNITVAGANPSGDGIVNLIKYALNLDPLVSQAAGLPTFSNTPGGDGMFSFTRNTTATDATLSIETCTDLTQAAGTTNGWQTVAILQAGAADWTTDGVSVSDNAGNVVVTDAGTLGVDGQRFFRLRVALP
jgi:hypothetical protein